MDSALYSYGTSRSCDPLPKIPSSGGHYSQEGFYATRRPGDVFLFSPSLYSRSSRGSTSQSSSSFDALSYIYSPADLSSSAGVLTPGALPSATPARSPSLVDTYLTVGDAKPITRLSPGTPFQRLFDSSPGGFWHADDLSLSPVSRHSTDTRNFQLGEDEDGEGEDYDEEAPVMGRIESLLAYEKSQHVPDSPQAPGRASSPSSLSSLSSRSSSPSLALSSRLQPSSQTSRGVTMSCSPSSKALSVPPAAPPNDTVLLTSPAPSAQRYVRRSTRLQPAARTTRRSLAAEILNQLSASGGRAVRDAASSSPSKWPSSPAPVCDSDEENYGPASGPRRNIRKRVQRPAQDSFIQQHKRRREELPSAAHEQRADSPALSVNDDAATYPNRTFPLSVTVHENFPLFYRRFPVSSVINPDLAAAHGIRVPKVLDGTPNPPRDALDLYTPRFVKGRGPSKVGLCPICHENVGRGGEGKKLWLSMKFSAFNYHMQYAHGISPVSGRPFSPPLAFRVVSRPNPGKHEKTQLMEGKCHKCKKWVAVEGIKDVPTKVKEIFWWKHAAACHQGSTIEGEGDAFVEDAVYDAVVTAQDAEEDDMDQDE
ncbi:hypothetical protein C8Q79DRAFT_977766 [Trametes meyenii]|nr:hypothetical protein C8Q79DRAFT_977766 [Trametes meyenii]